MTRLLALAWGVSCWAGCSAEDARGPDAAVEEPCAAAKARTGELECLHRVVDDAEWRSISVPVMAVDQVRSAKYLLPARSAARLPPLLMNAARHELHFEFLVQVFPQLFPGLDAREYLGLLFDPARREFMAGSVTEYRTSEGLTRYGFTVSGDPSTTGSITCDDMQSAREQLLPRLPVEELWAVPSDREQLGFFGDCGVPVLDPTDVEYEAYHRAAAFGTVRLLEAAELPERIARAELGFQDVLVLDQAPSDIETIVSGVVTATRQAPLSHVAVRSAARGTPNCYLKDALGYLASWQDQLVRLECGPRGLLVRAASREEAEAYWRELKPTPLEIPEPDRAFRELVTLEALELVNAEQRALSTARFGAKGRNLAWLRQNLEPAHTPRGFLIPIAHYFDFIEDNGWEVDLGDGAAQHSFAETLASWHADVAFTSDGAVRRAKLRELQSAMEATACDGALLEQVRQMLVATFGGADVTVRFRSSSNAEDGALFNGAGLYDSYSGCLADDLDADDAGPSACDPSEAKERGVCRALKRVWASLYNAKAYDERAFYGIDPARVAMGVLVNERSEAELANLVAFSGNPGVRSDDRFLVNAQLGELAVVSPEPGVWPEQVLLTVEEGAVTGIERVVASSLTRPDEHVVSDADLALLGAKLARLADIYPFDAEPPAGRTFLLDTEWKVMSDGSLRIKQVRPFLK